MILVCYLAGPGEEFRDSGHKCADSYRAHSAGTDHDLLLIAKGTTAWGQWPTPFSIEPHPNDGLDIGSLQRVCAEHSDYDFVMWLGAHCRVLASNWLALFHNVAATDGVGAVSATGSFEAGVSGERPNPHLRTSALMISPKVLNSLGFAPARTRIDCYEFEHGLSSLYRRLREVGLSGVVVDRLGQILPEARWATSHTFRRGEQEALLVADKQTDAYLAADPDERRALALMAGWEP